MKIIDKLAIAEFLAKHIPSLSIEEIETLIEIPPPNISFSYAFPVYRLSKIEKKNPKEIAQKLVKELTLPDFIEQIEATGPYLNFKLKPSIVLKNIFESKNDYGRLYEVIGEKIKQPLRIVIEYPSANTNHALHLGHVRNILIGTSISNLLKYKKQEVFEVNLRNDRGINICRSMLAYKKWGNNQEPTKKSDHFVGDYYLKYREMEQKDENLINEAYTLLRLWEAGDKETRNLWEKMRNWTLEGFKETFQNFDLKFIKEYNESEIYTKGRKIIFKNLEKGIFKETEDGAIFADLEEDYSIPNLILLRRDGTSLYATQDIYLAYLKKQDFDYDRSLYVVANEQNLYFKQLFTVLEMIGFKGDNFHLSYGMISLPEGRMKSREGNIVEADEIIEEVLELAYKEVDKRYPSINEEEKKRRANIIGMGALHFFFLKFNLKSDFIFNPKESISFEGETGPYIQYCFARIESIISKSKLKIDLEINWDLLIHETEINLIKQLNYFPEIIEQAAQKYDIHLIPQYLLTLCQTFNTFYGKCPVISEDKQLERARLLLIKCVQINIEIGLKILGIDTLDRM
ncbi:MAG: arginine--tRNA ligase [Promethearchaeota archaeon]|jgi:arginyl-tRNA synthetase